MRPIRFAACLGVVTAALQASGAGAQDFPTRPVRYIMPLPAGQETDVFARVLARRMSEGLARMSSSTTALAAAP